MSERIIHGKHYAVCHGCGRILKRGFFGFTHLCTTPEERLKYASQIAARVADSERVLANAT